MIRVLVVDDHRLVRAGLITLLEAAEDVQVVGEAADGRRTASPAPHRCRLRSGLSRR
jgi:DNA-binding NarL/FixJ family response regulator